MLGFGKVVFRIVLVCLSKNQIYFNFYNYLINKIITINMSKNAVLSFYPNRTI